MCKIVHVHPTLQHVVSPRVRRTRGKDLRPGPIGTTYTGCCIQSSQNATSRNIGELGQEEEGCILCYMFTSPPSCSSSLEVRYGAESGHARDLLNLSRRMQTAEVEVL